MKKKGPYVFFLKSAWNKNNREQLLGTSVRIGAKAGTPSHLMPYAHGCASPNISKRENNSPPRDVSCLIGKPGLFAKKVREAMSRLEETRGLNPRVLDVLSLLNGPCPRHVTRPSLRGFP